MAVPLRELGALDLKDALPSTSEDTYFGEFNTSPDIQERDESAIGNLTVPLVNSFRPSIDSASNFSLLSADIDNETSLAARLLSPELSSRVPFGFPESDSWRVKYCDLWISNKGCFLVLVSVFWFCGCLNILGITGLLMFDI